MITNDPQNYCFPCVVKYFQQFKKEELFLKRRSSGEFRQHLQDSSNHFSAQALLSNETHINMDEQDGAALIIEITEFLPDFILRSHSSFEQRICPKLDRITVAYPEYTERFLPEIYFVFSCGLLSSFDGGELLKMLTQLRMVCAYLLVNSDAGAAHILPFIVRALHETVWLHILASVCLESTAAPPAIGTSSSPTSTVSTQSGSLPPLVQATGWILPLITKVEFC
ncbi:unnamed protein product [Fasciola hepatica]|uniref:Uncharacterized protein n=1 Tax=Fasciola hepatica TaxID=6192 RepID=A0ABC9HHU9_FASHE